jgi:hypothetical protein
MIQPGSELHRLLRSMVAVAGAALLAASAGAQTCFTMQAEMMHLQSRGGGSFEDRARYERAYREQANVLAKTETRARQAGCFGGGFFAFRRAPDRSCDALVPKLGEMQDNLARLDHLRRQGGRDNVADRVRELQGMMNARGCDSPGGVLESGPDGNFLYDRGYAGNGTYSTVCVRTCDGYYFPISFSTTSDQFPNDARSCEALCPGSEARLFYYPNPGGGPENMTSITGEQYTSLPTAFQYRTSIAPACTCRPAGGYSVTATAQSTNVQQPILDDPTAPLPRARPAPGEDPETLADRAGYYVPSAVNAAVAGPSLTTIGPDGRPIRVVGPAYWGKKDQDGLVIAPVPN